MAALKHYVTRAGGWLLDPVTRRVEHRLNSQTEELIDRLTRRVPSGVEYFHCHAQIDKGLLECPFCQKRP